LTVRGKAILQEKCSRCHAVEAVGESPLKIAPPMRDIYARFAPRELQEELLEGKVSRHKEMPQIQFSHEDVAAVMAYLYELANRRLVGAIKRELIEACAESRASGLPARCFKVFDWSTRESWSRSRRVVAKAEWTTGKANPRFVVTSLPRRSK
jgi:hypothetical protein